MPEQRVTPGAVDVPVLAPMMLAVLAGFGFWIVSVGNVVDYFVHALPPGQVFYVFSKLAALIAVALLTLQIFLMLARRVALFGLRLGIGIKGHRLLGLVTLACILIHVSFFVTAASLRGGTVALDLLIPNLFAGAYDFGVGLGAVGLWLLLGAVAMGPLLRRSRSNAAFRLVHALSLVTLILVITHALIVGSEKTLVVMIASAAALAAAIFVSRLLTNRTPLANR